MINKPLMYVAGIMGGSFLLRYVSTFLNIIVGIVIPVYRTLHVMQQTSGDDLDEKKNALLMYWLCYAALTGIEQFIYWIPFYNELKLTSLIMLQVPTFNKTVGYLIVYRYITKYINSDHVKKIISYIDISKFYDMSNQSPDRWWTKPLNYFKLKK